MSASEKELFEKEIGSNTGLAEELRLSRAIDSALSREDVLDFRKKLLLVYGENRKSENKVPVIKLQIRRVWYAAASIIVLAALGSVLYFTGTPGNTNDSLFKQYYNSQNLVDVTRSGDGNIVEAVIKFQEKDYKMAAVLFKSLIDKDNNNIACWFYYGISSIETENFDQAEKAFNHIIDNADNMYIEHAQWYLGLTYLKNNNNKKAQAQFAKIAGDPDNFHRQEARHLLEKMAK